MKKRISAKRYFQRQSQHPKPQNRPPTPNPQSPSPSAAPNPATPTAPQPNPTEARSSAPSDICHGSLPASGGSFELPRSRRRRERGRPTTYTEDLADAIYATVREYGHTDTAAAAKYGVTASTVSRWKRENEDFATDLEAARAEYKEQILAEIRGARKRDGTLDWRAHAWILERTFPDEFGRRTRRPPEPPPCEEEDDFPDPATVLKPDHLRMVQEDQEAELRDPESWDHQQMEIRARERFEEMKAAYLAQNPTPSDLP